MNNENSNYIRLTKLIMLLSFSAITATVITAAFTWQSLKTICICISNHLAYSWIGFGAALILSWTILGVRAFCKAENPSSFIRILFYLQILAFLIATFYLVYFGTRVTDVI